MFIADDLLEQFTRLIDFRVQCRVLLDENHSQCDAGALAHEIDWIFSEWLEDLDGLSESSAGTRDTERDSGAVSDVRVVGLGKELDHARYLSGGAEENESE